VTISLLEDVIERAGHDPALQLRLRHLLGAALFYAGEYTRAAAVLDAAGHDYCGTSRRTTLMSWTAPTTPDTPTPKPASLAGLFPSCVSTCRTPTRPQA
jgi:hypothetical protein